MGRFILIGIGEDGGNSQLDTVGLPAVSETALMLQTTAQTIPTCLDHECITA
jgi:hypothetical protein